MEDKQLICDLLLKALQATECFSDLDSLDYINEDANFQLVRAVFANGAEKLANVTMDSGIAMIKDIIRQTS